MVYKPSFKAPTRNSLGLTTHVNYDKFNPQGEHIDAAERRKSLVDLDYSPLQRVTWASFFVSLSTFHWLLYCELTDSTLDGYLGFNGRLHLRI